MFTGRSNVSVRISDASSYAAATSTSATGGGGTGGTGFAPPAGRPGLLRFGGGMRIMGIPGRVPRMKDEGRRMRRRTTSAACPSGLLPSDFYRASYAAIDTDPNCRYALTGSQVG